MKLILLATSFFAITVIAFSSCSKGKNSGPGETSQNHRGDTTAADPTYSRTEIENSGFDNNLTAWNVVNLKPTRYGFRIKKWPGSGNDLYLDFYVPQTSHWDGAPQDAPWSGSITATKKALLPGHYKFQTWAESLGDGMFLVVRAQNSGVDKRVPISKGWELNTIEFDLTQEDDVTYGFECVNAGGSESLAPYFYTDYVALLKK
jgi:hypothetical protein